MRYFFVWIAPILLVGLPKGFADPSDIMIAIKIKRGETLSQVADKLYSEGVIGHPFWFKIWAKLTRNERKIRSGYYVFDKPTPIRKALRTLMLGRSAEIKITIPEGTTIREIADILHEECDIDKERFLQLTHDGEYVRKFGINANSLEGYLFPESYLIPYEEVPEEIIPRMVNQFFCVFTDEFRSRAEELGFTMEEIITLASLVEKEAAVEHEKPIISGIYLKRLKKGLLLQCDATIQYILPKRKPRLTYADLKIPSEYNTYLNKGLPPTPIASPGKSSIVAALWPKKTDYLYFVARGDGTHTFSKSLDKHNKEKMKVKKLLKVSHDLLEK